MLNLCFKDNFPKWIDFRSKAGCPDVLDDDVLNISPLSSAINCIRYLLKHTNQEDFKISRLYLYYYLKNNITLKNTLNFIKENGVCSEKEYPYDMSKIDITPVIKE